ncbi:hypothetical protein PF008_g30389 [Phytophthora fragariae]|uniref:pectinesterase n=1 Tax=Phytophthora fragariae TaxID=53985 RepID=A0A6G0Q5R0_9STRA|nr:hypothetical protein PF008_g30389 [Phytophthora fragariae]
MQLLAPLIALLGFAATVEGACSGPNTRITPPPGAIVVDATGTHRGSFRTLAQGVGKLSTSTTPQTIFVYPGVYREQVIVPKLNGPLILQGYTCDAMVYTSSQVTITQAKAQKDIPASIINNRNDLTTTLLLKSDNVKVYNLNVANTAGDVGQAIAVKTDGANYGFYACKFTGYQDTLYANKAWFETCDIVSIGKGCIGANGRDSATNPSRYVFNNARVTGTCGVGTAYLGRPWKPFSHVVWQMAEQRPQQRDQP